MDFIVFGRENCPYCVRAKELLRSKGAGFTYKDVVEDEVFFMQMNSWVKDATGRPAATVPQIFLDDRYIGGYTELVAHFESEKEVVQASDFDIGEL